MSTNRNANRLVARTAFAFGLAALAAPAPCVRAQCTMGTPYRFEVPARNDYPAKFAPGFETYLDLYSSPGGRRLVLRQNYGVSTFSLGDPAHPSLIASFDIERQHGFEKLGDGFQTVGDVAAAPDGSRLLVNYTQFNHGTLLLSPDGSSFAFGGELATGVGRVAVMQRGTRYLAFVLRSTGLAVGDVTSFVSGSRATRNGSLPSERVMGAPGANGPAPVVAGSFVVYAAGSGVVVVDASNLGDPGLGISSRFDVAIVPPSALGLRDSDFLVNATAALDPKTGDLTVLAETTDVTSRTTGIALASSRDGVHFEKSGAVYVPAAGGPWSSMGVARLVAAGDDLYALLWQRNNLTGMNKLFTFAASRFGEDLSPEATVDSAAARGAFPRAFDMKVLAEGSTFHTYTVTQVAGWAIPLSCGDGGNPAPLSLTASIPDVANVTLPAYFSASASGGKPPYTFVWDFGDGTSATGDALSHAYQLVGTYDVKVTVTDAAGATMSQEGRISVRRPRPVFVR